MVGRPRQAIEALTPKVAAVTEYPRDVVLVQTYLAEAHAAAGEREQAEGYASRARLRHPVPAHRRGAGGDRW